MDTLWLSGVLSNKQRVDGNYAWQQRIIKLARRIIDIEIRARKSAQAKGKEAEVEQAVPATDEDFTEEDTDSPSNKPTRLPSLSPSRRASHKHHKVPKKSL
ncbi:hypothetical protein SRDD_28500 [Serratia sp. DD3]|nr:hypothetical protein SRDD_28500 [Serratia sp. DD3]